MNDQDIIWKLNKTDAGELMDFCTQIAQSKDGASLSDNIRNAQGPWEGCYNLWAAYVTGSDKFPKNRPLHLSPPDESLEEKFREFLIAAHDVSIGKGEVAVVVFVTLRPSGHDPTNPGGLLNAH